MDLEKNRVDPAKVQDHLSSLITEYGNDEPHLGMNQGGVFVIWIHLGILHQEYK